MKSIYCFRGLRTVLDEILWNHSKYFFLSPCLFLSVCFNAAKSIWLESTLYEIKMTLLPTKRLVQKCLTYFWVHSTPIFDKKTTFGADVVLIWDPCWFLSCTFFFTTYVLWAKPFSRALALLDSLIVTLFYWKLYTEVKGA